MAGEPENLVLAMLREMRTEMAEMRAEMRTEFASVKDRLDQHQDELSVVSGLAIRATGERVAWASMQGQMKKLVARIEALERAR